MSGLGLREEFHQLHLRDLISDHLKMTFKSKRVLWTLKIRKLLVRCIRRTVFSEYNSQRPLRCVLVFRTGRLGDFINAVPALHLLRKRLPGARIVLATTVSAMPSMQAVTRAYANSESLPWLEFVVPDPLDVALSFSMSGSGRGIGALRRIIGEETPDAVFVLPNSGEAFRSKIKKMLFFRLAGYKGPIFGFDGLATKGRMQRSQFDLGLYEHEVYGPIRAICECPAIGKVTESEIIQRLAIPTPAVQWARDQLQPLRLNGHPLVAIAPGASFPHKTWPAERFIAVMQKLRQEYACNFVVVGADSERPRGDQLQKSLGNYCLDLTGKTTVTQLAAVFAECRLFVGNDSGPVHVASGVGCPCVTVTSALDFPGIWEPWNSRERTLRARLDCEFCLSAICCPLKTNACILAIGVEEVLRVCRSVLGGPSLDNQLRGALVTLEKGNLA